MRKKKPDTQKETLAETNYRLKQEAKEIVKNHVDVKPIKYLLK